MILLRYTGHPFVDVGVATITAFAGVQRPEEVTEENLENVTNLLLDLYMNRTMARYVGYVVFANVYFANPGLVTNEKYDVPRREALAAYLNLYKPDAPLLANEDLPDEGEQCIFSGDPAVIRASRSIIPLTSVDINFAPEGRPKFPVAGWCVLALLTMPLGALNSNGKLWIVHTPDTQWLQYFAGLNLKRNQHALQQQSLEKLPNYKFAKTRLMDDLAKTHAALPRKTPLTAYLFTSSGRKSELDIYHLPSSIVSFVHEAKRRFGPVWDAIVARAWETSAPAKDEEGVIVYQDRNFFYEDLFDLPERAVSFLRRYLLRQPRPGKATGKQKLDPRFGYSFAKERDVIHWGLTELFLERIMNIDKERIASIKQLADRLADYIQNHDARLFKRLFWARNDYQIRLELLKAANAAQSSTGLPLVPYEEFMRVFFFDEGDAVRPDWYLARDLLMIRLIERLHESGWIGQHPDIDKDEEVENEELETTRGI